MCKRVTCDDCGRPTWIGCGAHVEQVLGDVPEDQRCQCDPGDRSGVTKPDGFFKRLLG